MENQRKSAIPKQSRASSHGQPLASRARAVPSRAGPPRPKSLTSGMRSNQTPVNIHRGETDAACIVNGSDMSGDQALGEWLRSLGWRESLSPEDLRQLNTPDMQSIWRHLQTHVLPVKAASTVRKNVLLKKLKEKNTDGKFSKYKIDSINDLSKVEELIEKEEKKDKLIQEIKEVDAKIQVANSNLLLKNCLVQKNRYDLDEIENKTTVLGLKRDKLLRECENYNSMNETLLCLTKSPNTIASSEFNRQKSLVYKYVKNFKDPLNDSEDNSEYLCNMMVSIFDFKSSAILDGISRCAKEALITLMNAPTKIDSKAIVRERINSNGFKTFEEILKELKILIIKMGIQDQECKASIKSASDELEKENTRLLDKVKKNELRRKSDESESNESGDKNSHEGTMEYIGIDESSEQFLSQYLNNFLIKIKEERKNQVIKEKINELIVDKNLESMDDLKKSIISLSSKDDEIWTEIKKNESKINQMILAMFSNTSYLSKVINIRKEIFQAASSFKIETSRMHGNKIEVNELAELNLKEIEVFLGTPQVALQRKWDCSREMLPIFSNSKFANNPALVHLLHKEEKNAIVDVLKKYIWSVYSNPQY